jgi:hypothetical protein
MTAQRIQIATNIDPEIKGRLDSLVERTGWTFRKVIEEALRIGLPILEKEQDEIEKMRQKR